MKDKPISKEARHQYWQDHVQAWQSSALSQSDYCVQSGIKLSTFVYWRNLFLKLNNKKETRFAAVKIVEDKIQNKVQNFTAPIEIRLTTGHVIHLPAEIGMESIARLIHLLEVQHA